MRIFLNLNKLQLIRELRYEVMMRVAKKIAVFWDFTSSRLQGVRFQTAEILVVG
jgi:hypothetical protein